MATMNHQRNKNDLELTQRGDTNHSDSTTSATAGNTKPARTSSLAGILTDQSRWPTDVLKNLPLKALAGLLVMILCCVGSVLVLVRADGTSKRDWLRGYAAPNVILSILNSLSNLALGLTIAKGLQIGWWLRAMAGHTIRDLHYSWEFSDGWENVIRRFKYFNYIALAALMTKVAVVDGALYQQAISTFINSDPRLVGRRVMAFGATVFLDSGKMGDTLDTDGTMSTQFQDEVSYWSRLGTGINTNIPIQNCDGLTCRYGLQGAGFAIDCVNHTTSIDYGTSGKLAFAQKDTANYQNLTLFAVNFTRNWPSAEKNYSSFIFEIVQPSITQAPVKDGACPAELIRTTCEVRPALLNYTVYYTNSTSATLSQLSLEDDAPTDYSSYTTYDPTGVTGPNDHGTQISYNCDFVGDSVTDLNCRTWDPQTRQQKGINVIRNLDVNEPFIPGAQSKLEGFYLAYRNALTTRTSISYNGSDWFLDESDGYVSTITAKKIPPAGYCNFSFNSPQRFVLERINTLTLMVIQQQSLYYNFNIIENLGYASSYYPMLDQPLYNLSTSDLQNQTTDALVEYREIYYQTKYGWMYAALGVSLVVILGVLPVYWGFWRLDRKVSLSPLEIANAFRAPMFKDVRGDRVEDILEQKGDERIMYAHMP